MIEDLSVNEVHAGLARGEIRLIDVREPDEWAQAHVDGAELAPLSSFNAARVLQDAPPGDPRRIVLMCKAGVRSRTAAMQLLGPRCGSIAHMPGGMLGWMRAGLPVVAGDTARGSG